MSTQTRVGVVGLGYVGLPLALAMHRAGHEVVGVDVDADTVETLRNGDSTVSDVSDAEVTDAVAEGITFTTDYEELHDVDGVSICVPTPLRKTDTPDLSFVVDAAERLAGVIPDGCTVILESTVYPGATEEVVGDALTENGATVGEANVRGAYGVAVMAVRGASGWAVAPKGSTTLSAGDEVFAVGTRGELDAFREAVA